MLVKPVHGLVLRVGTILLLPRLLIVGAVKVEDALSSSPLMPCLPSRWGILDDGLLCG